MARLTVKELIKILGQAPNQDAEVRMGTGTLLTGGAVAIAATDTVTINGHGLSDGDRIRIIAIAGGAGLAAGTSYFVVNSTTNTFKLSATAGGAAIDITSDTTQFQAMKQSVSGVTHPAQKSTPPADAPAASLNFTLDPGVEVILG